VLNDPELYNRKYGIQEIFLNNYEISEVLSEAIIEDLELELNRILKEQGL
jgi:hypothetical protein